MACDSVKVALTVAHTEPSSIVSKDMNAPATTVIGSEGMLGQELVGACAARGMEVESFGTPQALDITDSDAVGEALRGATLVLNAAAYTDVDGAESEPAEAMRVNQLGPMNLARTCLENDALLVHYSTDFVFNGVASSAYRVNDVPSPLNLYGLSKLAGENAIRDVGCKHLIIRSSWLFAPHSRNFVRTILKMASQRPNLRVVADQIGRPTSCEDLARMTLGLIDAGAKGTVHAANRGRCTWFEFAREIVALSGAQCRIDPCKTSDQARPAARPRFSVLDLAEMTRLIGKPRHWKTALRDCIEAVAVANQAAQPGQTTAPSVEEH